MDIIQLQHVLPRVFSGQKLHKLPSVGHQDIRFERGKTYLIEAASGTGKSSMCSFVYGQRADYEGIITFDERNIRQLTAADWTDIRVRHLSLLFQELRLFPELTALENILLKNRSDRPQAKARHKRTARSPWPRRQDGQPRRPPLLRPTATRGLCPLSVPALRLFPA